MLLPLVIQHSLVKNLGTIAALHQFPLAALQVWQW